MHVFPLNSHHQPGSCPPLPHDSQTQVLLMTGWGSGLKVQMNCSVPSTKVLILKHPWAPCPNRGACILVPLALGRVADKHPSFPSSLLALVPAQDSGSDCPALPIHPCLSVSASNSTNNSATLSSRVTSAQGWGPSLAQNLECGGAWLPGDCTRAQPGIPGVH